MAEEKEKKTEQSQSAGRYADIIDLPHHVSAVHPPMSLSDRAAQFSPFSALTGLEEAMEETASDVLEKALFEDRGAFDDI